MDKPAMDLLSLPDDFKLQILKKLDWKSLKDLKLVCRDLYFLIEQNVQSLDRPKVHTLSIGYDEIKVYRIGYSLMIDESIFLDAPTKRVEFNNDGEYENFLKSMDFTKIKVFSLYNVSKRGSIRIHKDLHSHEHYSSTCTVFAKLPKGKSRFETFFTIILTNKKLVIPYNCDLLRIQSLRRLGIFEGNKTSLVIKKIIMDILTGNPKLEYKSARTDNSKPLYIQITNQLFKLGLLNPENACVRKGFKLYFGGISKFDVLKQEFYRKFFGKIKFRDDLVVKDNGEGYSIMNSMACSKCDTEHKNFLFYSKSCGSLHIGFH
uniref:F-box domain-containing protein n=1 Tax=Strongyloides venezuelensis TaxID=75913 RepID=A0A0K0FSD4_STRVS